MIDVQCLVKNYDNPAKLDMKVYSHWNRSEMVVLEVKGEKFTFSARDLKAAIDNCTNTNRFG